MKKITAVAIAVLVATQANATEVYKNEKVTLDLNGRAYAGHYFGTKDKAGTPGEKSEKIGANQFIRFGAKGDTVVTSTTKAIGVYEAQFNIGNNEKTLAGDSTSTTLTKDANGNITAVGTGNFGNGVYAPIYYDRTNNTYYMQPAGLTNLNTLRTQSFSLDTRVSGTYNKSAVFGGNGTNNQYRLGDLLPRYVLQEGYAASSGAPNVYKPLCGAGGEAKIILHPRADSWAFQANLNITVTDDGVSTSPATTIVRRQYMASDLGTYWRVNLTGTDHAEAWEAMAMTYCYYP